MRNKIITGLLLFLGLSGHAAAQTQMFSFNTSVVSLPGGKQTFAGMDSGITFTPTPNFDLLERNLISTGPGFEYYAGGFNYRIKPLSVGLNNKSPNVDGLRLQFFATASVGVDRISLPGNAVKQHYGFTAGGGVNYALTASGRFTLGGKVEYAKFPGWLNNTWIVQLSPAIHF